jgi:hypothetical protein
MVEARFSVTARQDAEILPSSAMAEARFPPSPAIPRFFSRYRLAPSFPLGYSIEK